MIPLADETGRSGNLFEVKTILFALSIWYRALFGISLTKMLKENSVKGVLNTMELSIGIIYLLKQKMRIPLPHLKGF